jgi:hypothetical protein
MELKINIEISYLSKESQKLLTEIKPDELIKVF